MFFITVRSALSFIKPLSLFLLFVLFSQHTAFAKSSVWQITKGENTFYLGGTIHLLKPENYPLPKEFDQANELSSRLIFETDIEFLSSPQFQQSLFLQASLPAGQTLNTLLKEETRQALEAKLTSIGIPYAQMQGIKPGLVIATMTLLELQKLGFSATGVDAHYYQLAKQNNKETQFLETPESQIKLITEMGKGNEDALITFSINDLEKLPQYAKSMYQTWRSGKVDELFTLLGEPMAAEHPELFFDLIEKRNNIWLPELIALGNSPEVEFVLVGALHLGGEIGVLKQLKAAGFTVTQL